MKAFSIALLFISSSLAWGAQVVKVANDHQTLAVTNEAGKRWLSQDELCILANGKIIACGKVIKTLPRGAILRLKKPSKQVAKGNVVKLRSDRALASVEESTASISSQLKGPSQLTLGIQAGSNLGGVSEANPEAGATLGSRTALAAGAVVNYALTPNLILETDILYSQKGAALTGALGSNAYTYNVNYNYLEVPFLLKYRFNTRAVQPFVFAGPYAAYLLSASANLIANGNTVTTSGSSSSNSLDYGAYFGAGAETEVSRGIYVSLVTRYGLGLANVDATGTDTTHLRVFQFLAGLHFAFFN